MQFFSSQKDFEIPKRTKRSALKPTLPAHCTELNIGADLIMSSSVTSQVYSCIRDDDYNAAIDILKVCFRKL
jgi:hypothetical protein